ncbi:NAD(P)/FAD-dependent oxidoreductase [Pelagibacterium luteolum]|uniref:D-amino-acid dehydrogenase n=1 Tax=Pelagibacterium luteolum TaxID=440168 RepID=A0A1G7S4L1_9HYPH|nr:FAD-binding oxidoreductase [Pelagibacterium luteolum]SDG17928.1 D-amino-acid dehydrogenase [Pelagibacterium luteolum]
MAHPHYDHCVIGAGIIGLSIAFRLAQTGQSVLIIDRKGMAEETSRGNAGALAFADIEPLASPGIIFKAPRWFFDPLGPLSLPLGYAPTIAPWLVRFFRAAMPDRIKAATRAQTALMDLARAETELLYADAGIADLIRHDGALTLYEGQSSFDAAKSVWDNRAHHGIDFETVTGTRLADLQPGLGHSVTHGVFVPGWQTVSDPFDVATAIGRAAVEMGARFEIAEVTDLAQTDTGVSIALGPTRTVTANNVVVAAGAWSHRLAQKLGDKIPLETERGYNTTFPKTAFDIRRQLVIASDGFVVSPLDNGVRVGGAVELAGLDRPPDFRRSDIMVKKASRLLPGLKTDNGKQWMGFRPSTPDSLPVIGRAPKASRVIYAFGHGHLGLTQAAATARMAFDLALGNPASIDLSPFAPERF